MPEREGDQILDRPVNSEELRPWKRFVEAGLDSDRLAHGVGAVRVIMLGVPVRGQQKPSDTRDGDARTTLYAERSRA